MEVGTWLVHEAGVPVHPVAPNPYTLLFRCQKMVDLKDVFFHIALHIDSQFLLAFENPHNKAFN